MSSGLKIAEFFRTPEDLDKIPALLAKLQREKDLVDGQLKAGTQTQMEVTFHGMDALRNSQTIILSIKEELERIDTIYAELQAMSAQFPQIDRLAMIHKNFLATEEMMANLAGMHQRIEVVERMLREDGTNPMSPMPNLLPIHYELSTLQDFRDQALHQALKASEDVQITLKHYFERLNRVSSLFHERIVDIGGSLLDIIRSGNAGLIVRASKIIDLEDKSDSKVQAMTEARQTHGDLVAKFKSMQIGWRKPRFYKQEFFSSMKESIVQVFSNCQEHFEGDPSSLLEHLDWVFTDLDLVQKELVLRMPRRWGIFDFMLTSYNEQACLLIKKIVDTDPEASIILKVVEWIKLYYSTFSSELGVSKDSLTPKILDGNEASLIEDYLQLIIQKIDEWMANMSGRERTDFIQRVEAPETDADELYGMQGTVIMFQMISQQIDVAADSGQGRVLASVISACVDAMKRRQASWDELLKREVQKVVDGPDQVPGGLLEYTIALANDQIKSADYAESISNRVKPLVSSKYSGQISTSLESAIEGFVDVAQDCVSSLTRLIFLDLRSAVETIFTPAWYTSNVFQSIIDTLKEYLADSKGHLQPSLFECLVEDLLESTLVAYLSAIRNKGCKLQTASCMDIIQGNIGLAFDLFSHYLPADDVEKQFDVFQQLFNITSATKITMEGDYATLKSMYPDVQYNWVESILRARDDVDSSMRKAMLEIVRNIDKADTEHHEATTIMGKLKTT